ncbi:uncharacterized protein ZK1073.1-like isoform X3 [Ostrea edulis]|uniref:uncharacterized protein ZK1073.1-like isoform X3 n=1 Tax=Ostrea edulis TaxID=37623 RepID=UPI0020948A4C|nr:uncharacterized protein ZK1073.1-like isoform X3 [Ostrea edulis]
MEHREISSPRVEKFNVYIEGDLKHKHFVILTLHDLGCNHTMWSNYLQHPSMAEINKRAAFVHVDFPGQEDNAVDLPPERPPKRGSGISICYSFPSMQSLGEDLVCVLDRLDIKQVVGLGEGAGANVLARFAMAHPTRVLGVCLIHCTGTTAGIMEGLKDKLIGWKLDNLGMNPTAEAYLMMHRFGSFEKASDQEELNKAISSFQHSLRKNINPQNLKRFVKSFMKRTNIADNIGKMKCQVLLVTGSLASFNHTVHTLAGFMLSKMDKSKVEIIEVEGVANVIEEKPDRLAEAFLYFCQGLGVIGGVPMPRMTRANSSENTEIVTRRTRSMSMEEADKPLGIYSSSPARVGSPPKLGTSPCQGTLSTSPPK